DGGLPPDLAASLPIGMVVKAIPTSPPVVRLKVVWVSGTAEYAKTVLQSPAWFTASCQDCIARATNWVPKVWISVVPGGQNAPTAAKSRWIWMRWAQFDSLSGGVGM